MPFGFCWLRLVWALDVITDSSLAAGLLLTILPSFAA